MFVSSPFARANAMGKVFRQIDMVARMVCQMGPLPEPKGKGSNGKLNLPLYALSSLWRRITRPLSICLSANGAIETELLGKHVHNH